MTENIKKFLTDLSVMAISNNHQNVISDLEEISKEAKKLLAESLKEETLKQFAYPVEKCERDNKYLYNAIKNKNKIDFIQNFRYHNESLKFIDLYFYELDKILDILNEYLTELEQGKEEKVDNE